MIQNDKQLAVSRRKLEDLKAAAESAELVGGLNVYQKLASDIQAEIDAYLGVRDGYVNGFGVKSLDDVADVLVKARIARKWTQKELADRLGVAEQSVQRDEAGGYENAGLARIADVAQALEYELSGHFCPVGSERVRMDKNVVQFNEPSPIRAQVVEHLPLSSAARAEAIETFRIIVGKVISSGPAAGSGWVGVAHALSTSSNDDDKYEAIR